MSVVHMWLPGDGQTAVWCGHDQLRAAPADCAVTCHLVDAVTCMACLRSARDLVSACTTRLRALEAQARPSDEVWSCPAHSNECAIRRRCTNKCGALRNGPTHSPSPAEPLRSKGDAAAPKWIQLLLDHLEWIADSATEHHAPEISARNIIKLATVVAELVKHVAAKEQP